MMIRKGVKHQKHGFASFLVWNQDLFDKQTVNLDDDPMQAAAVRTACLWAHLMEQQLSTRNGKEVVDVAKQTFAEADAYGMGESGTVYHWIVSFLIDVWQEGDELREWYLASGGMPPIIVLS